ncbi:MAG: ATP-binding protein [Candidatus Omnitrophota bacterium]|nr:ATP-binding protein [Candidatus Omnitrophota bacterium]
MYFNFYSLPPLISGTIILIFGILIFLKKRESKLNLIIFFWCLAIFVWLLAYSLCYSAKSEFVAGFLSKIACTAVAFLPNLAYHFTVTFLDLKKERKFVYLIYAVNLSLVPLFLFSNYFLSGVNKYFFGYYGGASFLYPAYLIFYFAVIIRAYCFFYYALTNQDNLSFQKQSQAKYVTAGFVIASFASVDFLPKFGIAIYPIGYIFMLFWIFIISYAILKHQLIDINIVIRKGLAYSVLVALISAGYLIIVMLAERISQGMIGYSSLFMSILYASALAIFFIPARNMIQNLVDKIFLGKNPIQIAQENELLKQELEKSERMKAVVALASGMAHEIKNPLTALKTFAEYLPQKINDPEFLQKFSKIVGTEVGRIDNLVHQLLEFAKPSPLKLEEVDIHKLLDDTLELLSNDFIKHNIKVIKDFNADLRESIDADMRGLSSADGRGLDISGNPHEIRGNLRLRVDSNRIRQAFLNLFLNAIDAMPSGGTLTVSTNLRSSNASQSAIICVQDTGIGIPDKLLPHIFEPFHSTKEKGTGLGLSITYGIIREHNGNIKVDSKLNQGTGFIIELPLQ